MTASIAPTFELAHHLQHEVREMPFRQPLDRRGGQQERLLRRPRPVLLAHLRRRSCGGAPLDAPRRSRGGGGERPSHARTVAARRQSVGSTVRASRGAHHSSQIVAAAERGIRAPKHGWRGREAGEGTVWRVLALVRGRRGARGSRAGVVRQSRGFASRMLAHADTESWRLAARECDASVSVRVSLGRPISSPAATRLTSMSEP